MSSIVTPDYSELLTKFVVIPNNIFTIQFNVLEIDEQLVLRNTVCFIFKTFFETVSYHKINPIKLKAFIKDVSEKYNDVPYHNFYHATQVLHTTYLLIKTCNLFNSIDSDILFSTLVSALVHDIGHPGNTNSFEVNTCSELAYRYNDISVLEQHHCYLTFELIKQHNLFENYTNDEFMLCRKTIIQNIIGTDMSNHKNILDIMEHKKSTGFNFTNQHDDQFLIAKILLHASDISNPIQEYKLCEEWARKINLEFQSQVRKEKEKGLKPFINYHFDSKQWFYEHELGYINFVCEPFWKVLTVIFPDLKPFYEQIIFNSGIYEKNIMSFFVIENKFDISEY